MKGMVKAACVVVLSAFCISAAYAQASKLSGLASTLAGLSGACEAKAQAAKMASSTALYQNSLDSQLAIDRAQMDARVYGVGHGGRETTEYLADQLQNGQNKVEADRAKIAEKLTSDRRDVESCVSDAETQGKNRYSSFKADHKRKSDISDAESIMTAWLTNLKEISVDTPQGSEATNAAWKTAKAHAEISDL